MTMSTIDKIVYHLENRTDEWEKSYYNSTIFHSTGICIAPTLYGEADLYVNLPLHGGQIRIINLPKTAGVKLREAYDKVRDKIKPINLDRILDAKVNAMCR